MSMLIGAVTGRYKPTPPGLEPNCVIGQTFGNDLNEAMQAKLFGMQPVLREGLPPTFNPRSTQVWARSRGLWAIREVGIVVPLVSIQRAKEALTGKYEHN